MMVTFQARIVSHTDVTATSSVCFKLTTARTRRFRMGIWPLLALRNRFVASLYRYLFTRLTNATSLCQ